MDYELRTLKIRIRSHKGGKIDADLPVGILKPGMELGLLDKLLNEHESFASLDFARILKLVEEGYVGEVLSETTAEGDDRYIVIE